MLLSKCHNRAMPSEEEISVHMADSLIPPYMPKGARGARITMTSAISLINRYCSSLPCDMATKLTPRWEIKVVDPESNEKEYYCRLRMPINSPLRQIIIGDTMKQKRLAKMAAALKACKLLDECGELNEHLVPVSCLVDKALEEELGPTEEEITDETKIITDGMPGTKRRKQLYKKHVPKFLRDSRPTSGVRCYLHIFEMDLVEPLPDCLNPRKRPLFNPKDTSRGVALLSSKILPSVNPFPIFTKFGRILVKIHALETSIILVDEEVKKLEEFHKFIFSDALWLVKDKEFSPQCSPFSYYIVPVNKDYAENYYIDWSFIDATKVHPYNDIKQKTSTITRTQFDEKLFESSVLMRSYKMHEWENTRPTFHHVTHILYDMSPQSRMNSELFKDYYKRKYSLEILNDKQPLVETVQSGVLHFWKPIYNSVKETFEDICVLSKTKQRHMNYREYLVPELCIIHPFPSPFFSKVSCLPTILFRLHSLLLAEEIRQNVASQGFIGSLHLKPNHVWPEFNLETSDKALREKLYKNGHIKAYVRNVTEPKDVIKIDGKISSFEVKVKLSDHPGPEPSLILQALTSKGAGDEFDLERLEMIGDSFLKYVMSVNTYYKYSNFDEGKLSKLRSGLIQNLHLYQIAKKKKLAEYLICTCFSCNTTWLPPCFIVNKVITKNSSSQKANCDEDGENAPAKCQHFTEQIISDKCIADSVEALIGVYLLSCGQQGALRFMYWLGLNPLLKNSSICNHDFESWPPVPPDPILAKDLSKDLVNQSLSRLTSGFDRFEKVINYSFKNKAYLLQAFTHPSYVYNEITDCYQRLEFLGDAVLDYIITRQLYEDPNDHSPGMLTDLRSALVNNVFFAWQAVKHKYHEFLKMLSPHLFRLLSDYVERLKNSDAFKFFEECGYYLEEIECFELDEVEVPKALSDIFESVAGAIYLDSGMSLDAVWNVYYPMIEPALKHLSEHVPKSPVRELYEISKKEDVFGEPVQKSGKTYIEVELKGKKFVGVGPNKKVAKRSAAKRALAYLKYKKEET
ncbi:Endoribonuclease Dcr-1, partial [Stegodyphus mimosarum]